MMKPLLAFALLAAAEATRYLRGNKMATLQEAMEMRDYLQVCNLGRRIHVLQPGRGSLFLKKLSLP